MQIHELYQYKSHYERDIIDRRWYSGQTLAATWENPVPIDLLPPPTTPAFSFARIFELKPLGPTRWEGIKWIDLFGKHPTTYFTFNETWNSYSMLPLSRRFIIFKFKNRMLKLAELDWTTKDVLVGEVFSAFKKSLGNLNESVLIDNSFYPDEDVRFLLHAVENRLVHCLHCRVNSKKRKIETISQKFELIQEEFNFTNLHGNVMRGLSATGFVTQFDLRLRQKLPSIKLNNIPPSISSNTIAWSRDRLFLAKVIENGELESYTPEYGRFKTTLYYSSIYNVNLESGDVTALSYTIDDQIRRMEVGLDGQLYLSTIEILPEMSAVETKYNERLCMEGNLLLYRHLRIPIRQPESLFLLAVAALPRPIPLFAYKLIIKRDNIPMELCKY